MFSMQEPYYGIILSSMNRVPLPAKVCPTIGVGRSGNCFKLGYNPEFISKLDVDTTLEVLKHECLHLCLQQFSLWDKEDVPKSIAELRNIAEDLEVNCYIDRSKIHGIGGCFVEDLGWEKSQGAREYFRRLLEKAQQQSSSQKATKQTDDKDPEESIETTGEGSSCPQQDTSDRSQNNSSSESSSKEQDSGDGSQNSSSGQNDSNGNNDEQSSSGSSGNSNDGIPQDFLDGLSSFDDHSMWPDSNDDLEETQAIIEEMMINAAEECEKSRGAIPAELRGKIDDIKNRKRPKPVADWKRYVRRYLGHEFSEFIRKSKKRESRRFPDAAGNRHRRKSHILVGIDTSGSICMPEYHEFFGQIRTLCPVATFDVVECDARIQHEYTYKNKPNLNVHGGGGTSFVPVVDRFLEQRKKYDALIYFTDGYATIPNNTPKETLWVVSSQGDQNDRKKYQVGGASVVFIPKKN